MNGRMPYFRCYAAQWLSRLSGLPPEAQLLVFKAVLIAWDETQAGRVTRTISEWAKEVGCGEVDVLVGATALEKRAWCKIAATDKSIEVHVPEMDEQAEIVNFERDKTRRRRSAEKGQTRGQTRGHLEGVSEGRASERPAACGSAPEEPAAASEEERHRLLGEAIRHLDRQSN